MAIFRGPGGTGDSAATPGSDASIASTAAANAAASAVAAASSASSAGTDAGTAQNAAANAANSQTAAATSAGNAATSASAASASASSATASATAAALSESNTATLYDNFDDRYLGVKTTSPATDNDGNTLQTGALYFNSTTNDMFVWTGSLWTTVSNTTTSTNAATSAAAALASQNAAATSASNAATSATNASNSASTASTQASNASSSASAANTSASNAASSASSASSSASTATTQASNASTSATNAASSASAASTSASNASTSASNASTSATSAAASATSAAASYDSFDDRYLGAKSSAPTLDNDGNALLTGAIYWNTSGNALWVWDGSSWLPAAFSSAGNVTAFNTRTGAITLTSSDVTTALTYTPVTDARTITINGTTFDLTANRTWSVGTLTSSDIGSTIQGYDGDLQAIGAIAGTSGLLKKTAANTWSLDTNTYLTSYTETDPIYVASSWYSTTNNSSNWNTAYGWGNHASAGYVPGTRTLTINGTSYDLSVNRSWTIDALPSQTGNSGKYLTTNGTVASWATITANPALDDLSDVTITSPSSGQTISYNGSGWVNSTVTSNTTTKGLFEHSKTISTSYSVTAGNNAMSTGPLTISSGVSVTVPSGSRWIVL
jgi:hypothetical protein